MDKWRITVEKLVDSEWFHLMSKTFETETTKVTENFDETVRTLRKLLMFPESEVQMLLKTTEGNMKKYHLIPEIPLGCEVPNCKNPAKARHAYPNDPKRGYTYFLCDKHYQEFGHEGAIK